ncbi:hypothetical protein [Marinitenerispora sediminis]|uniref:Uncharacterized protein n=1 Tax=Marinitenerispora sediminis TaxID=1931232 RepID=A0A368T4W3_9ACTN|nr:hypothetical protein [Marinitenerispora sediminis]RCV52407.1 hypothetical protein DEF23_19055 [Marinitenerispora sediminis]RCV53903.1 hypothetical protein DEF28_09520 [Marinitenerispora sediminis]RCV58615.1 hypothetical protein DEF24_12940 [Marinitenerispora sediminis]
MATFPEVSDGEEHLLQEIRDRYPDWLIARAGVRLVATHRTERPDPERERALVVTRVVADYPEQLAARLYVQEALRSGLRGGGSRATSA